ncbi:MAG: cysteine desulfurase [Defluviitaleaceae bacterium]|nr:cysteine desulfurase [Defluviitaleaceae bacterium]MCL2239838.1 cysteine desulfurase [Defluviitaleaceae bacterium]
MIYLDNAATTPPLPFPAHESADFFANPSSPHKMGIVAERALTRARATLSELLHCAPKELVFTSGGTEANNLAILGYALAQAKKSHGLTIFAEPWAHPSILAPVHWALEQGLARGIISPAGEWRIPGGAVLCCLSHVNHETGNLMDLDLPASIKKANPGAAILVDGAQGFCKDFTATQIFRDMDFYTFSGHKFHACTGVGGLVVRNGIKLAPLMHGGAQENNLRPGTENTAGIFHMAHAARFLHGHRDAHFSKISALCRGLSGITDTIPGALRNQLPGPLSPYILNLSFPGAKGEVLVHMLSEKGICLSMGAACKSRRKDKSALAAMGYPKEIAESALRFSFSHFNTPEEIQHTLEALTTCVNQLRKISGYK